MRDYSIEMFCLADRMHAAADANSDDAGADALRDAADNLQQLAGTLAEGE